MHRTCSVTTRYRFQALIPRDLATRPADGAIPQRLSKEPCPSRGLVAESQSDESSGLSLREVLVAKRGSFEKSSTKVLQRLGNIVAGP